MRRKGYSVTLSFAILFLVSLPSSYSDDTLVADYGKTVAPAKTDEISMIKEEVVIKIDDHMDDIAAFPLRRAHVNCAFWFKNISEKLIQGTVGFPGNKQDTEAVASLPITDFVTRANGQQYSISIKREILEERDTWQSFRNWYTWQMKFPANSIVKVENSYLHYLSSASGYEPLYLNYELSTGANWKGTISDVIIKIIYNSADDLIKRVCGIKPNGWVRRGNEIVWHLQNVKPTMDDNIFISERNLGVDWAGERRQLLLFGKE